MARLFEVQPERWVVKGGAALLLRLDPNRTSNDIDLAYVAEAGEHAVALEALADAAAHDAGDFFEFEIARRRAIEVDRDHPLERAVSVPVLARIGGTVFAEFSVDLALPRGDVVDVEWVEPEATLTGGPPLTKHPQWPCWRFPRRSQTRCARYSSATGPGATRPREPAPR